MSNGDTKVTQVTPDLVAETSVGREIVIPPIPEKPQKPEPVTVALTEDSKAELKGYLTDFIEELHADKVSPEAVQILVHELDVAKQDFLAAVKKVEDLLAKHTK